MSINCNSCSDLREQAADFVQNGVTEDICISLQNNTGYNTTNTNDNCTDLENANDCLIGNMANEIEAYDVCDWKEFARKLVPNIYNVIKSMICWLCGIQKKQDSLCELVEDLIQPPVLPYGTQDIATDPAQIARRVGHIPLKSGKPTAVRMSDEEIAHYTSKNGQNIGIAYAKKNITSCQTGTCEENNWISPSFYLYYINDHVVSGDCLWYATKEELQSVCDFSESLWNSFTISSYTWRLIPILSGDLARRYAWVTIMNNPAGLGTDKLGIVFGGTSYPNANPTTKCQVDNMTNPHRLYRYDCQE